MTALQADELAATRAAFPARFSVRVLETISDVLSRYRVATILDPFAGVGGVHALRDEGYMTYGIEIEREWARTSRFTFHGDARYPRRIVTLQGIAPFDAIITSPVYGNRLSDHHNARDGSERRTYRHRLGRPLSKGNAGAMQWGDEYRELHAQAWDANVALLRKGGLFVLNISDHIRGGERIPVAGWHVGELQRLGLMVEDIVPVHTPRARYGENGEVRVDAELVIAMVKT